jgi:hypothetical protein
VPHYRSTYVRVPGTCSWYACTRAVAHCNLTLHVHWRCTCVLVAAARVVTWDTCVAPIHIAHAAFDLQGGSWSDSRIQIPGFRFQDSGSWFLDLIETCELSLSETLQLQLAVAARSRVNRCSRVEVNAARCARVKYEMISTSASVTTSPRLQCNQFRKFIMFMHCNTYHIASSKLARHIKNRPRWFAIPLNPLCQPFPCPKPLPHSPCPSSRGRSMRRTRRRSLRCQRRDSRPLPFPLLH